MTKKFSREFKVKRMRYHIRNMYEYAKAKCIDLNEITEEEMQQFEIEPISFRNNCWPLNHKEKCVTCGKKTGYVDHVFDVYVCSKECMNEVDKRYLAGEEIEPSKVATDILEEVAKGLFE